MHSVFRLHKKKHNRKGNMPSGRNMRHTQEEERVCTGFDKPGGLCRGGGTVTNGQGQSLNEDRKELGVNYAEIWWKNIPIRANSTLKFLRLEVLYPFRGISRSRVKLTE